jgi:hypothetical protein
LILGSCVLATQEIFEGPRPQAHAHALPFFRRKLSFLEAISPSCYDFRSFDKFGKEKSYLSLTANTYPDCQQRNALKVSNALIQLFLHLPIS